MAAPLPTYVQPDYDDAQHLYHYSGNRYLSATQLIDRFKNHFNVQQGKEYMVNRYGGTAQDWGTQWKDTTDKSLTRGNRIHNDNECQSYGRGFEQVNGKIFLVHNIVFAGDTPVYYNLPDGSYPELKLWRHDYRVAGRADKVTFETKYHLSIDPYDENSKPFSLTVRYMHIEDYKTNKVIYTQSFKDKNTGKLRMMLGPLSHLMDCHMVHYTLQLSLYQFMGEYFGFLPGVRRIIHYKHPIEGLGTPDPVVHELPYLRSEVIAMLKHVNQAV